MRHWKDFTDKPVENVLNEAGIGASREDTSKSVAEERAPVPPLDHEEGHRAPARSAASIEEVTDRIYRRFAIN